MIFLENAKTVDTNEYDEVWLITRKVSGPRKNMIWVPELSPSEDLFFKYCKLKREGKWNEESFKNQYVPVFIKEMTSETAKSKLNLLYEKSKSIPRIAIACYCDKESLCHKSIIGGMIAGSGAPNYYLGKYNHYFDLWKIENYQAKVRE